MSYSNDPAADYDRYCADIAEDERRDLTDEEHAEHEEHERQQREREGQQYAAMMGAWAEDIIKVFGEEP